MTVPVVKLPNKLLQCFEVTFSFSVLVSFIFRILFLNEIVQT